MEPDNDVMSHKASSSRASQHGHLDQAEASPALLDNSRGEREPSLASSMCTQQPKSSQIHQHVESLAHSLGQQSLETSAAMARSSAQAHMSLSLHIQDTGFTYRPNHSAYAHVPPQDASRPAAPQICPRRLGKGSIDPNCCRSLQHISSQVQTQAQQPQQKPPQQPSATETWSHGMEVDEAPIVVDDNSAEDEEGHLSTAHNRADRADSALSMYKSSGRLPFRSSREAAMSCRQAVLQSPRMRRRKQRKRRHLSAGPLHMAEQLDMGGSTGLPIATLP